MQINPQLRDLIPAAIATITGLYMLRLGSTPIRRYMRLMRGFNRTTGSIFQVLLDGNESELIVRFRDHTDRIVDISCNRDGKFAVGDQMTIFYSVENPLNAEVQIGSPFEAKSLIGIAFSFIAGFGLLFYAIGQVFYMW